VGRLGDPGGLQLEERAEERRRCADVLDFKMASFCYRSPSHFAPPEVLALRHESRASERRSVYLPGLVGGTHTVSVRARLQRGVIAVGTVSTARSGVGRTRAGAARARSYCRFAPPLIHFIPYSRTYSVPLLLKRHCDRTPGAVRRGRAARGGRCPSGNPCVARR
jgi:hypothetical protein